MDNFSTEVTEQQVKLEKEKARAIRKSRWWSSRIANGICSYCGNVFPSHELTMDHVVPIIRGGKSVRGNLVPACKECNNSKKYLLPQEWDGYLKQVESQRDV